MRARQSPPLYGQVEVVDPYLLLGGTKSAQTECFSARDDVRDENDPFTLR